MRSADSPGRSESATTLLHDRSRLSLIVGFLTLIFWFVVLEVSDWANRNAFEARQIVLICLGVAVILLFVSNVAALVFGIWSFRTKKSARNLLGIALNGGQVVAIATLIAVGLILNARR
jgi:hypothetical protein